MHAIQAEQYGLVLVVGAEKMAVGDRLAGEQWARRHAPRAPRLRACSLGSAGAGDLTHRTARHAYDQAGIEPADLDLVELHDATASVELIQLEQLGIAERDRCGPRQVHDARLALAHNAGGHLGDEEAAAVVTVVERGRRGGPPPRSSY